MRFGLRLVEGVELRDRHGVALVVERLEAERAKRRADAHDLGHVRRRELDRYGLRVAAGEHGHDQHAEERAQRGHDFLGDLHALRLVLLERREQSIHARAFLRALRGGVGVGDQKPERRGQPRVPLIDGAPRLICASIHRLFDRLEVALDFRGRDAEQD